MQRIRVITEGRRDFERKTKRNLQSKRVKMRTGQRRRQAWHRQTLNSICECIYFTCCLKPFTTWFAGLKSIPTNRSCVSQAPTVPISKPPTVNNHHLPAYQHHRTPPFAGLPWHLSASDWFNVYSLVRTSSLALKRLQKGSRMILRVELRISVAVPGRTTTGGSLKNQHRGLMIDQKRLKHKDGYKLFSTIKELLKIN